MQAEDDNAADNVVPALDEMGDNPGAVKAVCAIEKDGDGELSAMKTDDDNANNDNDKPLDEESDASKVDDSYVADEILSKVKEALYALPHAVDFAKATGVGRKQMVRDVLAKYSRISFPSVDDLVVKASVKEQEFQRASIDHYFGEYKPTAIKDLIFEQLCKSATTLFGKPVFMTKGYLSKFVTRCQVPNGYPMDDKAHLAVMAITKFLPTTLSQTLRNHCENIIPNANTRGHKTLLCGGYSGAGKTMAVIGLGSREGATSYLPTIVVMGAVDDYRSLKEETNTSSEKGDARQQRNAQMVRILARLVEDTLSVEAHKLLTNDTHNPFRVVLALDEMGDYPDAVKAVCAIEKDEWDVGDGEKISLKQKLHSIIGLPEVAALQLVVAGTGVGNHRSRAGSDVSTFISVLGEGCPDANREIFTSFATGPTPFELNELYPFIDENSRMAAVLGLLVKTASGWVAQSDVTSHGVTRKLVDVRSILQLAAFQFKSLNALHAVPSGNIFQLLCRSLRMQYFGHCATSESNAMEVTYGLVLDQSRFMKVNKDEQPLINKEPGKSGEEGKGEDVVAGDYAIDPLNKKVGADRYANCIPTSGRYRVPRFTVAVLGLISDSNLSTRSVMSGDTYEYYFFVVSYLLACAAGSSSLFDKLLAQGSISPLVGEVADNTAPPQPIVTVHDLRYREDESLEEAVSTELSKQMRRIEKTQGLARPERLANRYCYIAAFRSIDKSSSADSFIFLGGVVYFCQMKDCRPGSDINEPLERWKMGALDVEARDAFEKDERENEPIRSDLASNARIPFSKLKAFADEQHSKGNLTEGERDCFLATHAVSASVRVTSSLAATRYCAFVVAFERFLGKQSGDISTTKLKTFADTQLKNETLTDEEHRIFLSQHIGSVDFNRDLAARKAQFGAALKGFLDTPGDIPIAELEAFADKQLYAGNLTDEEHFEFLVHFAVDTRSCCSYVAKKVTFCDALTSTLQANSDANLSEFASKQRQEGTITDTEHAEFLAAISNSEDLGKTVSGIGGLRRFCEEFLDFLQAETLKEVRVNSRRLLADKQLEKFITPHRIVRSLIETWHQQTGVEIQAVQRVFVVPSSDKLSKTEKFPSGSFSVKFGKTIKEVADRADLFVTTENIEFLKFNLEKENASHSYSVDGYQL